MRQLVFFMAVLLLTHPSWGTTLNVLVFKRAPRAELSFTQNYAVVIDGDHFYGPVAKEDNLKLENVAGGRLRLSVRDAKTGVYKALGNTRGRVDVVRVLSGAADMNKTVRSRLLQPRPLAAGTVQLEREAERGGRFVRLYQAEYGGEITYEGPLSAYARKGGVDLVETVELERYVTQVVMCELGGETSLEALKTQSVLARTFALYTVQDRLKALARGNMNWKNFQLVASASDQAYNCKKRAGDREPLSPPVKKAAAQTRGQVLLKNGKLVLAQYQGDNPQNPVKGAVNQGAMVRLARGGVSYHGILNRFFKGAKISSYQMPDYARELAKSRVKTELDELKGPRSKS